MIWFVYNILFVLGFFTLLPKFIFRMCRRGGYAANFMQRFGLYQQDIRTRLNEGGRLWIQAVSVGEIFVAFRLIDEIRKQDPDARFVLSTNTSTGYAIGQKNIDSRDVLIYFPLDLPFIMKRIFSLMQPAMILLIENEMWPNMIRHARRKHIPVVLVNGRISPHSFKGYCKVRTFTRRLLPLIDLFCVQSKEDGQRLEYLGAPANIIQIMGSAKYDVVQSDPEGERLAGEVLSSAGVSESTLLLMGASTWPGEEDVLLRIYKKLKPRHGNLRLFLVPRHVERTNDVVSSIEQARCSYVKRSKMETSPSPQDTDVILLDTTGEMKNYFAHTSIIFVGKSLTQHGGQNPIEPAFYGKPVIVGPNMENFAGVIDEFRAANALIQINTEAELEEQIDTLLRDEKARKEWGEKGASLVREKAGALTKTVNSLHHLL